MMPARKVAPSLKFGERPSKTIGSTATKDTMAARTGVKLVMEEGMLAAYSSEIKWGNKVGNDGDNVLVVEADTDYDCGGSK